MTANTLTYFPVQGSWYDVESPLLSGSTSAPQFLIISGFVTFYPRVGAGQVLRISNLELSAPVNAVQVITIAGQSLGGTFTLSYGGYTTSAIAYNATAATVQTAITGLTSVGASNAAVTGNNGGPWTCTFQNTLGGQALATMTITPSLTGTNTSAGIQTTTIGQTEIDASTSVALAPITGRIYNGVLSTIDATNTVGIQLLANTTPIQTALTAIGISSLIYDVQFSNVIYNLGATNALTPFAFTAPTSNTTVTLTDPNQTLLPYGGP